MCGIVGICRRDDKSNGAVVELMAAKLIHRGPDDYGGYCDQSIAMAARRLSIIDLETGHQPISNETGTIWTVFNGEIYNYRELHHQLQGQGHQLRSRCDTEAIVHMFEE